MDVEVTYGGDKIPESPFPVDVAPPLDLDQVKVKNLDDSKFANFLCGSIDHGCPVQFIKVLYCC